MADVGKVTGPSGRPEQPGKKERQAVDSDKFRQEMRKRVTEVSQIDPDEQKKRKRREEAEGETAAEQATAPATPPPQIPPTETFKESSAIAPTARKMAVPSPSAEEMEDDAGLLEEEAFSSEAARQQPSPSYPQQASPTPSEGMIPQTRPAEPAQPQVPQETKRVHEKGPERSQESGRFFEEMGKKPKKTPEELEKEAELQGVSQPAVQAPSLEEKGKKEEAKPLEAGVGLPAAPGEIAPEALPMPLEPVVPYANLHPAVMEIFDRMVGVMTVMSTSGMTETTFTLNAPQFASSVFFGAQIIIQEFSTAPRAYNIQLNASPQAVALFQGNIDDLMAAFQAGNYNFRVNRLETGYLTERPLFKRKEKTGEKEKETGDQQ